MKPVVMLSVESCIRKTCGKAVMAAFVKPASKAVSRCYATYYFAHVGWLCSHIMIIDLTSSTCKHVTCHVNYHNENNDSYKNKELL